MLHILTERRQSGEGGRGSVKEIGSPLRWQIYASLLLAHYKQKTLNWPITDD